VGVVEAKLHQVMTYVLRAWRAWGEGGDGLRRVPQALVKERRQALRVKAVAGSSDDRQMIGVHAPVAVAAKRPIHQLALWEAAAQALSRRSGQV
jgi:hypothetical protein